MNAQEQFRQLNQQISAMWRQYRDAGITFILASNINDMMLEQQAHIRKCQNNSYLMPEYKVHRIEAFLVTAQRDFDRAIFNRQRDAKENAERVAAKMAAITQPLNIKDAQKHALQFRVRFNCLTAQDKAKFDHAFEAAMR